jgi:hypothetical protein
MLYIVRLDGRATEHYVPSFTANMFNEEAILNILFIQVDGDEKEYIERYFPFLALRVDKRIVGYFGDVARNIIANW